ncbi:alginate export family protein [Sphingomonas sp. G-3-2-10]|uniref:alginate export family protein n=1 Tax=Sphingomonas sp. G-3-2-10 TaxID=2728838 RepID=UPI001469F34B|nr:alginate export family protein [Sphingomonas sp. G-3-2-10]NML08243.1 alginate export family protein [Sphingomonas sp. G-3-2-10]
MKFAIATVAALAAAGPACAQTIVLKPLIEARLRGEMVDQTGIADHGDAVTLRVRAGVSATRGKLSVLAEAQGNLAIVDRYYDGLHGAATRPLVGDPENVALYRAQLQYRSKPLTVTVGRQRIALDDERFVGSVAFRQNGQTFDAVRVEWTGVPKLKADVSYAWGVRTIWGVEGNGARQQAVSGDNVFANLSYASPIGTVTGFAYLVDQDEAAVQGFRLSSQTYGGRISGTQKVGKAKLGYQLSYARQQELNRNPNRYAASYYLAEGSIDIAPVRLSAGYEVLGADRGVALTSFQTPTGTLFKFNGWADKFLTTPPDGLRDLYATIGFTARKPGITLQASYHRFESDRLVRHYGDEIDLLASMKLGRYTFSARYAQYDADLFATDTRKAWLQIDWAF